MQIDVLASTVSDNFFYLVHGTHEAALVDPVDAATAIEAAERLGKPVRYVINTHWHPDHTAGNDEVLAHFAEATLVCGPDAPRVNSERAVDRQLQDGETFAFDDVTLHVLLAPGHTDGHIILLGEGHLISGDVIFVAGAGHCRTGDPGQLFRTFRDVLGPLGDDVRFYPGHDYSRRNTEFALSLQPDHAAATAFLAELDGRSTPVLTTLGNERRVNPFFRYADPALRAALQNNHEQLWSEQRQLSECDDEATFRTTRALRNVW